MDRRGEKPEYWKKVCTSPHHMRKGSWDGREPETLDLKEEKTRILSARGSGKVYGT